MKFTDIKLPSNKKFGYFFSAIFLIITIYCQLSENHTIGYIFAALTVLFFMTTLINAKLLLPLNKIWMRFGLLLGSIINPIVLGIIFFVLFTPYGIVMRIFGRDELRLKKIINKKSHWVLRSETQPQTDFRKQF
jgi:hypothetical protein